MKRKWLMLPLVTGILAAGLTGATALAHNGDGEEDSPKSTVATKVAEILDLDEETVKNALREATRELRSERISHRLGHLVESGRLTQEQADAYLEWYEARPDVPNLHRGGHRLFGFGGGGDFDGGDGGPRSRFDQQNFRGQRFGGQDAPGLNRLPNGREFPGLGQRANGRGFSGRENLPPWLGQLPNGQEFPGQGQLSPGPDNDVAEANGASF